MGGSTKRRTELARRLDRQSRDNIGKGRSSGGQRGETPAERRDRLRAIRGGR